MRGGHHKSLARDRNDKVHEKVVKILIFLNGLFRVGAPIWKTGAPNVDSLQFSKLKLFLLIWNEIKVFIILVVYVWEEKMVIEWKKQEHTYHDELAMVGQDCLDVLWNYGLLKFFMVPSLKAQLDLL